MSPRPLPPGTILQQLYVRRRLRNLAPGQFVEIGVGDGSLSQLLLDAGWRGVGYEVSTTAGARARATLRDSIADGTYELVDADWLSSPVAPESTDLVISSLVVEHLDDDMERAYFERARATLREHGRAITIVPSSPAHWGVEDEIAGHYRRYTQGGLHERLVHFGWEPIHTAGLTYPLSNWLLPVSNRLVQRAEGYKERLSMEERTRQSGHREVRGKTTFPLIALLLLNEYTLRPLYWLQLIFRRHRKALILYSEARPRTGATDA